MTLLEALGNIGDFVGGIAVILTLAYLALQIRQNTKQIENNSKAVAASAYQSLTELVCRNNSEIAMNREYAEFLIRADQAVDQLDEVDRFRHAAAMSNLFRIFENIHQQHAAGLLMPGEYETWTNTLRGHLSSRVIRRTWDNMAPAYSPQFQAAVAEMLESESEQPEAE